MSSEDTVVVLKPRQTMNIKEIFQHGELGAAIAQYVGEDAGAALSIWPIWTQNLVVCGTQHIEAANKLTKDFDVKTGADSHSFRGHVKLNGEVCRGVIRVRADETTASLKNQVKWREGEIAFVRKLGKSNIAVLTFVAERCRATCTTIVNARLCENTNGRSLHASAAGPSATGLTIAHTRTLEDVDFGGNMWVPPSRGLTNMTVLHAA
ncbi:hypothetical protein V5799_011029 [Amblyomma americanum]|uniref:Uncharacterized protein n=1 Tax=Amblyomma americanum TaxID=6943 RepID=A0AAQ4EIG4_AMBAM